MAIHINEGQIKYICKQMMGTDWLPKLSDDVLLVIGKCDSKLEVMYLLGAIKQLDDLFGVNRIAYCSLGVSQDWDNIAILLNNCYGTITVFDDNGKNEYVRIDCDCVIFRPQQSDTGGIHRDFGIYTACLYHQDGDVFSSYDYEVLMRILSVEIDGYATHKNRRLLDVARDSNPTYKVIRLFEESSKPDDWITKSLHCVVWGAAEGRKTTRYWSLPALGDYFAAIKLKGGEDLKIGWCSETIRKLRSGEVEPEQLLWGGLLNHYEYRAKNPIYQYP
jgi:hypothetical protein